MSEFKYGDVVRIEFEGRVLRSDVHWSLVRHVLTAQVVTVKTDDCNLIAPEIVLPETPGTIVQVDPLNEQGERAAFELQVDLWFESGGDAFSTLELTEQCRQYGYRVIPAATPEEVK